MRYSIQPREQKCMKRNGFLSFVRNFSNKYGKNLINSVAKTGTDAAKLLVKS